MKPVTIIQRHPDPSGKVSFMPTPCADPTSVGRPSGRLVGLKPDLQWLAYEMTGGICDEATLMEVMYRKTYRRLLFIAESPLT
jgi:hypothetical protein